MLRSAVWFISNKCNMNCPYCLIRGEVEAYMRNACEDFKKWVNAWNTLAPLTLDITGGEPFMFPNFVDMLEQIDSRVKIAITTNLKCDIADFAARISPQKVFSMTLSLHPTMMNFDLFMGKVLFLKNRGFNITVNFVSYPEQLWLTGYYKQQIEDLGIRFHLDYYVTNKSAFDSYAYTQAEKDFINKFLNDDRAHFQNEDKRPCKCSGGVDHIQVYPDGTAYRCMRDMLAKDKPVGNILADNFTLLPEMGDCADSNKCAGCDKDKVKIILSNGASQ